MVLANCTGDTLLKFGNYRHRVESVCWARKAARVAGLGAETFLPLPQLTGHTRVWCPCCPCRERAGSGFVRGVVSLCGGPWSGGYLRQGMCIAIFVPTSHGWLSFGVSGDPSEDGSCRKFIISLLVKRQSSHCLRISMACKCLGEGWQWGSRWGAFWKQASVSSHRRANFKHANNFQFHFSFFLFEGSCTRLPFLRLEQTMSFFMLQTISFCGAGMGWCFSGCLCRVRPIVVSWLLSKWMSANLAPIWSP